MLTELKSGKQEEKNSKQEEKNFIFSYAILMGLCRAFVWEWCI